MPLSYIVIPITISGVKNMKKHRLSGVFHPEKWKPGNDSQKRIVKIRLGEGRMNDLVGLAKPGAEAAGLNILLSCETKSNTGCENLFVRP